MSTIYVGLLTIQEKDDLIGQVYIEDSFFNPVQDNNNDWVISVEEINQCENPDCMWVKDLPIITYVPKPSPQFPYET